MVHVLPPVNRGPSLGQRLAGGFGQALNTAQQLMQERQQAKAMQEAGIPVGLPPELAKTYLAEKLRGASKEQLLEKKLGAVGGLFGGRTPGTSPQLAGSAEEMQAPGMQGIDPSQIPDEAILELSAIDPQLGNAARGLKDVALREKRAAESKEFEREKFEYKKGHEKEAFARKEAGEITKPLMLELQQSRKNIPLQEQAIEDIKHAVPEVGALDYFADVTGFEPARSAEGAKLKTAIKDFFLSDLTRAGARPNMWIEQQLADALPKIGRSPEANLITAAGMQFKVDLAKKRIEFIDDLAQKDMDKYGYVKSDVDSRASALLKPYVEQRKKNLIDEITSIKKKESKINKEIKNKEYVRMISPDGILYDILPSDVEEAESHGFAHSK